MTSETFSTTVQAETNQNDPGGKDRLPSPDSPVVIIEASKSWVPLRLKDLWNYRELLYFLTWRDVKVRYKQTLLGVIWVVLQPLLTMLIFTLFFGKLAGIEKQTGGIPYPVFVYAGLLPWGFFSNAITNSGNSLVASSHLITKVYFPRLLVPISAVVAGWVDFAVSFAVLVGLMIYYHVAMTWTLLMLPVLVLMITLFVLGVGAWLSALNVKYRDVRFVLPFLIQLWMFLSPVIYPPNFVPQRWRWLLALNPLTGIIQGFRSAFFSNSFDWTALGVSAVIILVLLVYAAYAFKRMERRFADII